MSVFTQSSPLASIEPVKVARSLLANRFVTPDKARGLWTWRGMVLEWFGGQWVVRDHEWLEASVWLALEDAYHEVTTPTGREVRRFAPTPAKVDGVLTALTHVSRLPNERIPCWVEGKGPDPDYLVTFRDKVVDARTGESSDRTERWVEPTVIPVDLRTDAGCPRWRRCLDEWSEGREDWIDLLQRMFGYCLLGHRKYAKWFLLHGKVRGGKGTVCGVLRRMLGRAYVGTSLEDLARPFGLHGLQNARVLSIGEVSEIKGPEAEAACRVLKQVLGRDPMVIDVKYHQPLRDVVVEAVPIMQANEIPKLPNKGLGLSSKMVPIPFNVSFIGREDHHLADVLEGELQGIAAWALEGAMKVARTEASTDRFPLTREGESLIEEYTTANNPVDDFLEEHFVRSKNGFAASSVIYARWESWVRKTGARRLSARKLIQHLKESSSWDLSSVRVGKSGMRGLSGLVAVPLEGGSRS